MKSGGQTKDDWQKDRFELVWEVGEIEEKPQNCEDQIRVVTVSLAKSFKNSMLLRFES